MPAKSERQREESEGRGQEFYLTVPGQLEIYPSREKPIEEKTALWVPYGEIVKQKFSPSRTWPEVFISKEMPSVLKTIASFGQISPRNELEDDSEKQQVIFYTAIICNGYLLFISEPRNRQQSFPVSY